MRFDTSTSGRTRTVYLAGTETEVGRIEPTAAGWQFVPIEPSEKPYPERAEYRAAYDDVRDYVQDQFAARGARG